jgi:hypothetical protein
MDSLVKSNFTPKNEVKADDAPPDATTEYEKKAIENIGGSMVFVERRKLYWTGKDDELVKVGYPKLT